MGGGVCVCHHLNTEGCTAAARTLYNQRACFTLDGVRNASKDNNEQTSPTRGAPLPSPPLHDSFFRLDGVGDGLADAVGVSR